MSLLRRRPKRHVAEVAAIRRVAIGLTVTGKPKAEQVTYSVLARVLTGPDTGAMVTWTQPNDYTPGCRLFLPEGYTTVRGADTEARTA